MIDGRPDRAPSSSPTSCSRSTSVRTTPPPTACCGCCARSRARSSATSSRSSATSTRASRRAARTSSTGRSSRSSSGWTTWPTTSTRWPSAWPSSALLEEEVPPRAQYLRVIHMELNRIASHLFWLATGALDIGAITMLWWGCRDRDLDARPVRDVLRPALPHALLPGGRRDRGHPARLGGEGAQVHRDDAIAHRPVSRPARPQRDLAPAHQEHRASSRGATCSSSA